jgi:hypothetical protein
MRSLVIVAVAACAAPHRPPVPTAVPPITCAETPPSPSPLAAKPDPIRLDRDDEIRRELASIEHEIDAIDADLAGKVRTIGATRAQSLKAVEARLVSIGSASLDDLPADAPTQLFRIGLVYRALRTSVTDLEHVYGPRHPTMVELGHRLDHTRDAFERQRAVEIDEARTLALAFAKLRDSATRDEVRIAYLTALADALERAKPQLVAPSDAPAELRVAVDRYRIAVEQIARLSDELGPKHPDMIRWHAIGETGEHDIAMATEMAVAKLVTEAELLKEKRKSSAEVAKALDAEADKIDATKLSRRVELAMRARELRDMLAQ